MGGELLIIIFLFFLFRLAILIIEGVIVANERKMPPNRCRGITTSGKSCRNIVTDGNYCHIHSRHCQGITRKGHFCQRRATKGHYCKSHFNKIDSSWKPKGRQIAESSTKHYFNTSRCTAITPKGQCTYNQYYDGDYCKVHEELFQSSGLLSAKAHKMNEKLIAKAIKNSQIISLNYYRGSTPGGSRDILPKRLHEDLSNGIYLEAYCYEREDDRHFNLDFIRNCKLSEIEIVKKTSSSVSVEKVPPEPKEIIPEPKEIEKISCYSCDESFNDTKEAIDHWHFLGHQSSVPLDLALILDDTAGYNERIDYLVDYVQCPSVDKMKLAVEYSSKGVTLKNMSTKKLQSLHFVDKDLKKWIKPLGSFIRFKYIAHSIYSDYEQSILEDGEKDISNTIPEATHFCLDCGDIFTDGPSARVHSTKNKHQVGEMGYIPNYDSKEDIQSKEEEEPLVDPLFGESFAKDLVEGSVDLTRRDRKESDKIRKHFKDIYTNKEFSNIDIAKGVVDLSRLDRKESDKIRKHFRDVYESPISIARKTHRSLLSPIKEAYPKIFKDHFSAHNMKNEKILQFNNEILIGMDISIAMPIISGLTHFSFNPVSAAIFAWTYRDDTIIKSNYPTQIDKNIKKYGKDKIDNKNIIKHFNILNKINNKIDGFGDKRWVSNPMNSWKHAKQLLRLFTCSKLGLSADKPNSAFMSDPDFIKSSIILEKLLDPLNYLDHIDTRTCRYCKLIGTPHDWFPRSKDRCIIH